MTQPQIAASEPTSNCRSAYTTGACAPRGAVVVTHRAGRQQHAALEIGGGFGQLAQEE